MDYSLDEAEQRGRRDDEEKQDDDKPDMRAIHDCYRDELISKDEARALMGFRDDEASDDDKADDDEERDDMEDEPDGDEAE